MMEDTSTCPTRHEDHLYLKSVGIRVPRPATNIAEMVIFMVKGKDIRPHQSLALLEW